MVHIIPLHAAFEGGVSCDALQLQEESVVTFFKSLLFFPASLVLLSWIYAIYRFFRRLVDAPCCWKLPSAHVLYYILFLSCGVLTVLWQMKNIAAITSDPSFIPMLRPFSYAARGTTVLSIVMVTLLFAMWTSLSSSSTGQCAVVVPGCLILFLLAVCTALLPLHEWESFDESYVLLFLNMVLFLFIIIAVRVLSPHPTLLNRNELSHRQLAAVASLFCSQAFITSIVLIWSMLEYSYFLHKANDSPIEPPVVIHDIFVAVILYIFVAFFPMMLVIWNLPYPTNNNNNEEVREDEEDMTLASEEEAPCLIRRQMRMNGARWLTQASVATFAILVVFWGTHCACFNPRVQGLGVGALLARGGAQLLRFSPAVLLTVVPFWLSGLIYSPLGKWLPWEQLGSLHVYFGVVIAVGTALHVGGHCVLMTQSDHNFLSITFWKHDPHALAYSSGGAMMVFLLGALFSGWLLRRKQQATLLSYEGKMWVHRLSAWIFIGLLAVHGLKEILGPAVAWMIALPISVIYAIAVLLPRLSETLHSSLWHSSVVLRAEDCLIRPIKAHGKALTTGNVFILRFSPPLKLMHNNPTHPRFIPCRYIELCAPLVSGVQYHRFSLISCPDHDELHIKAEADGPTSRDKCAFTWTARLLHLLYDLQHGHLATDQIPLKVMGPFVSPSSGALLSRNIVFVSGGVGITPLLSMVHYLLANPHKMTDHYIRCIWSTEDAWHAEQVISQLLAWTPPPSNSPSDAPAHLHQPSQSSSPTAIFEIFYPGSAPASPEEDPVEEQRIPETNWVLRLDRGGRWNRDLQMAKSLWEVAKECEGDVHIFLTANVDLAKQVEEAISTQNAAMRVPRFFLHEEEF